MENKIKLIPYGISSFDSLRRDNYYYVDKTNYIRELEETKYVLFLRPRRFGKSLFVNTLISYYDINSADRFDTLFGDLSIGKDPTPLHNTYLMLPFGFSGIDCRPENVQESFDNSALLTIKKFLDRYRDRLRPDAYKLVIEDTPNSAEALKVLAKVVEETDYKIYVTIDEYDNFANTLMSVDEDCYNKILHADGYVRLFYNVLKEATTSNLSVIERIYITGVSPLCLSDVTSGFNIAANISTEKQFNAMVGFTTSEVREMIKYYHDAYGCKRPADETVDFIKPYYDNYCFSKLSAEQGEDHLFNSDQTLFFLRKYNDGNQTIPEEMIDENSRSDYKKMAAVLGNHGDEQERVEILQQILEDGYYDCDLKTQFQVLELGNIRNLVSLLYYLGLLTYGRTPEGDVSLIVANEAMRQQHSDYLSLCYAETLHWSPNINKMDKLWTRWARYGEWKPFIEYVLSVMHDNDSVRDHGDEGEAFVKGFLLAHICHGNNYIVRTEAELGHGYSDILLYPTNRYKHALLIELKYLHRSETDNAVKKIAEGARSQIKGYMADKRLREEAEAKGWVLHAVVAVVRGWDAEIIEEVE